MQESRALFKTKLRQTILDQKNYLANDRTPAEKRQDIISRNRRQNGSRFVAIERRTSSNTVFHVDDSHFKSSTPASTHWSVAWSDLMMTMFVLFLCMFVYQMAHDDFLEPMRNEVIGGDTTEALQSMDSSGATLPISPLNPGVPLMTAGTIKKVEPVPPKERPEDVLLQEPEPPLPQPEPLQTEEEIARKQSEEIRLDREIPSTITHSIAVIVDDDIDDIPPPFEEKQLPIPSDTVPNDTVLEPRPLIPEEPEPAPQFTTKADPIQDIYKLSRDALQKNDLSRFASIDVVPDKTMRIILTGDLLFSPGDATLSYTAKDSLYALASVLKTTPYMINVVGHTDSVPMASSRYRSNWELSVARASTVARFLINEINMNPAQFVVSGYASYRPVAPNDSAANRAKNRRVEIIISKRLPTPLPATTENLQ